MFAVLLAALALVGTGLLVARAASRRMVRAEVMARRRRDSRLRR
jgi:hypothetical protein